MEFLTTVYQNGNYIKHILLPKGAFHQFSVKFEDKTGNSFITKLTATGPGKLEEQRYYYSRLVEQYIYILYDESPSPLLGSEASLPPLYSSQATTKTERP